MARREYKAKVASLKITLNDLSTVVLDEYDRLSSGNLGEQIDTIVGGVGSGFVGLVTHSFV